MASIPERARMTQIRTKQKDFGLVTWYGMRRLFYCLLILTGISSSYAALPSSIPAGLILYDTGADLTGTYCSITLQQGTNVIFTTQLQSSGNAQIDMILVRFDSNGSLDKTFGFNGRIRIGPRLSGADIDLTGINGQLCSGVIQADGKIVLGGMLHLASESQHIWVLRLNQDGQLDKSFGNNGFYEQTNFSGGYYDKTAIAIDSEQRIIVANSTDAPIGSYYNSMGLVIRLTNNGQLDSSFNDTGSFVQNGMLFFSSILVQSDNSILLGGYNAVLIHLTSGGKLDTSFADNGILNLPLNISSSFTMINSINSDSAGRIIATGYGLLGYYVTIIYRFDAKGNLDPSFVNGYVPYLGYTPAVSQLFNSSNIWLVGSTSVAYYDDYVAVASLKDDGTGNPFNTADISYPSTPTQRTWRMILDNNFCGEPAEGAIFQGDKILVLGTYNCRDYNGIYLIRFNPDGSIDETFGQSSPPPPEEKVPVVLVHGINGNAYTFGDPLSVTCAGTQPYLIPGCEPMLEQLLEQHGFKVETFDYSSKTHLIYNRVQAIFQGNWTIEQLAGELAIYICEEVKKGKFNSNGSCSIPGSVDIVAHSMGGLIARAYIAGMAVDRSSDGVTIPYDNGAIRKLVMIATPNYGAPRAGLENIFNFLGPLKNAIIGKQLDEMEFGSKFIWDLNQKWQVSHLPKEDMLVIAGTTANGEDDDGVVPVASTTLPVNYLSNIRYVPYSHMGDIAYIQNEQHLTYMYVLPFLLGESIPQQVDYSYLDAITQEGLLLVRLADSKTKTPISPENFETGGVVISGIPVVLDGELVPYNQVFANTANKAGTITVWPINNGQHALSLMGSPKGYSLPENYLTVEINGARPTSTILWLTRINRS